MSEKKFCLRLLFAILSVCAISAYGEAVESPLAPETRVRLQSDWIDGDGWRAGMVVGADPCTMIRLDQPMAGGYNRLALMALSRLQVRDEAGKWEEVDLAGLLTHEPTGCHEEGAG